ncbi:MAG: hypothetical protein RIQ52_1157 [Pseudomonadota bacterium]|jgi:purine-binding chemotaxis protein CheW
MTDKPANQRSAVYEPGYQGENQDAQEYLIFRLGTEEYGVNILHVQEIRNYETMTRVPYAPVHMKGVVNLRGVIVPVIDLRMKFNLPDVRYDELTVVIVLHVANRITGIVVDSVSDVFMLGEKQVQAAPDLGDDPNSGLIVGLGTLDEHMLILLDAEKLVSHDTVA